jgi:hypothetical protein
MQEPRVHLVCVSFQVVEVGFGTHEVLGPVEEFWLDRTYKDEPTLPLIEKARVRLKELLVEEDLPILCHASAAEMRSLHSMGLGVIGEHEIKILDTYVAQRQLTHTYPPCKWGRMLKNGELITSYPPVYVEGEDEPMKDGKYHDTVGNSLADALAHHLGVKVDTDHKTLMRNKIIAEPEFWEDEDRQFVQAYCTSDIKYLAPLFATQLLRLKEAMGTEEEFILRAMINHGRYMSCIADREDLGMPINTDAFYSLAENAEGVMEDMISDLVTNHYAFYERTRKTPGNLKRHFVKKQSQFNNFLLTNGLFENWVETDAGAKSMKDEVLKPFDSIPEIYALRQTMKTKQNLGFFSHDHRGAMLDRIGSDGRMRSYPHPFGTQTGRDAPKPSQGFVLNMAKWLRWMVQAPEGMAVLGCDWGSQEFAIAAALSGDAVMKDVYESGDVYLGFGIRGGLVPEGATKKTHGAERQSICKPVILGKQFGLGIGEMSRKMSAAQKRTVTYEECKGFSDLYNSLFQDYVQWSYDMLDEYREYGNLIGPDGWSLLAGQDRALSVRNWPIQGMGGALLRKACWIARCRGLSVFSGHHDALYALVDENRAEEWAQVMEECMAEAVAELLPSIEIRRDMKILPAGKGLLEDDDPRVVEMFEKMKKYFHPMETEDDYVRKVLEAVKKNPQISIDMTP